MDLICLGLNHTTAPLSVRERVAFAGEEIATSIETLRQHLGTKASGALSECLILSTCNRTEVYCACEDAEALFAPLLQLIAEMKSISTDEFEAHSYHFIGKQAARHAYRVVSGIDSMVLGETQIAGQVKKAVQQAREARGLGLVLNHLFQSAFSAAKIVRSKTAIGRDSVSLSAAAVRLAQRLFGDLASRSVLYIGAGEMIELCAAHFGAQHPKSITVANRSLDRGQALAARYGGKAIRLRDLPNAIAQFDIIVSCTASALPIIGLGMMARAVKERKHEPVCVVDLAVPRDVEAEVEDLDDVYVYTIDDLGSIVQTGKENRANALKQAEELVDKQVESFVRWKDTREAVPEIITLRERAQAIGQKELAEALRMLSRGEKPEVVLERLSRTLVRKFSHDATVFLRNNTSHDDVDSARKTIANFFRQRGL